MRPRFVVLTTLFVLAVAAAVAIFLARGYQLNISDRSLTGTGILVATSDPDGAEVFVDGKLTTATNNSLNLPPGTYQIAVKKDGYSSWEKKLSLKQEEVFKTNAFLFPRVPDLRPVTLTGALNPSLSPDGTKIAFSVASASGEKNGVYVLDMGRGPIVAPIISSGDLRQIYRTTPFLDLSGHHFSWSSDSRQILAESTPSGTLVYLLEATSLNDSPRIVNSELTDLQSAWEESRRTILATQTGHLAPAVAATLATSAANLSFSPDESKLLYQATTSAWLPNYLSSYLPGTNPTPENRVLKPGQTFVYDLKEDRNYAIENCKLEIENCAWFPSSRHLITSTTTDISLVEYDGTNRSVVYAGPFVPDLVFSWPNWSKIVILTSLNGLGQNLYTINLR